MPFQSLAAQIKAESIAYLLISFVDLSGATRAKLIPSARLEEIAKKGVRFSGGQTALGLSAADPDVVAMPDASSFTPLPWKPQVGWLAADLFFQGVPLESSPRQLLKAVSQKAAARGVAMKHGVECEFFILCPDLVSTQPMPCYNQAGLMRRYDVLTEICDGVLALGWNALKIEQENAHGQFEINWGYEHSLVTADRHAFFKYMAKSIAAKHGFRLTFMPALFSYVAPTACHAHFSLWDGVRNVFADPADPLGLSPTAYHFLGGVIAATPELCAVTNPTVNSYKRTNALVGAGKAKLFDAITFSANRTHMFRVPSPGRFEFRLPDGAVNPYLLPAVVLAAGLDGLERKRDPGKPLDFDRYEEQKYPDGTEILPIDLLAALRAFETSPLLRDRLGERFTAAFAKLGGAACAASAKHLSEFDWANTMDC